MRSFSKIIDKQQQEDAQEFFTWLLDKVNEEMVSISGTFVTNAPVVQEEADDDGWEEVGKKNQIQQIHHVKTDQSPLSELFTIKIRTTILKQRTKNTAQIQPYYCIPLDILAEDIYTVDDALVRFLSRDAIHSTTSNLATQNFIENLPPILTIQLKRFTYNDYGPIKIQKHVSFPLNLEMNRSFLAPNSPVKNLNYSLFACKFSILLFKLSIFINLRF